MNNLNKREAEITAILDNLAEKLLWQEPGAASRCIEAIQNEKVITTTN